jgi:hypothetical protein
MCLKRLAKNVRHFPWRGFYRVHSRPTLQHVLRRNQFRLSRSVSFASVLIFSTQWRLDLRSDLKALHDFFSPIRTCYSHRDICKLCGWFCNRWRVGGGRDPSPFSCWLESFYPGSFLALWPSWFPGEVVTWAGRQERDARYLDTYSAGA